MHYFIFILFVGFFYASDSQPAWVKDLVLTDTTNVYVGIGFSPKSKEEAKDNAFKDFSSSIKLTVNSETTISSNEDIKKGKTKTEESFSSDITTITEEQLRGINITEYWNGDGGQGEGHYILVVYDIDEFNSNNEKLIAQEIKRTEEELLLAKQQNENEKELLKQEMELKDLESEKKVRATKNKQKQAELKEEERDRKRELKDKKERRKAAREKKLQKKYPNFPKGRPPYRLIDSFAGESTSNTHSIIAKGTIKPALINELGYTYRFGFERGEEEKKFNISIDAIWNKTKIEEDEYDNDFAYMKNHIKFDFFSTEKQRISGSLGIAQYIYNDKIEENLSFEHSFFMSANYGFWAYLTDVGGYIDKESVYFNLIHYPLYNQVQEQLAIILEVSSLFDERLRDDLDRKYGIQFGVLFKTTDKLTTKFTYENYEDLMLSIELDL